VDGGDGSRMLPVVCFLLTLFYFMTVSLPRLYSYCFLVDECVRMWSSGGMTVIGEPCNLCEKSVPVPLYPPQISYALPWL
jgi:hypothetical protein